MNATTLDAQLNGKWEKFLMNRRYLSTLASGFALRLLLVFCWVANLGRIGAAELQLEIPRVLAEGRVELRFNAEPTFYYRLLRGITPDFIQQPVLVSLQGPLDFPLGSASYFRLEQIPRSAAVDTDGDGVNDVAELAAGANPLDRNSVPAGLTRVSSSPADGEQGVAVTREMVFRFTRALSPGAILGGDTLFAEAAGRRVLTRAELSTDRQVATLFYLEPLPPGAQVKVTLDGSRILDADNRRVDADDDGLEGGKRLVLFSTVNNRPVPRTAVIGRVFASELTPGAGNVVTTVNRPLKGVTITVDGMEESIRAVTDADGNFRLTNAPAGRFFVHVDGRTAEGSDWPSGSYYPYVGKAWEGVAGREDTLANGTGEIFLPLIRAGTLEPVSNTRATLVSFPAEVLASNPALEGVQLMVPAGSLYDDNGVRGGRVGMAPVSPDRLPEPLPDGLRFPLVITVQTDGPANFAEPVPVCFPNLPDPDTGLPLPPGARSALWSFDHDEGTWNIVGGMTVSADGRLICSNPGVGIREPGWHGTRPGAAGRGGPIEEEDQEECQVLIVGPIGGSTNQVYHFITSLSGDGSWSWAAPGGEPAFGSGPQFDVSFPNLGSHSITVRYTSADGETECTDVHSIVISPEQCEVRIVGPVEFPAGSVQDFSSLVRPNGGRFRWIASDRGSFFGQGNTPDVRVRWSFPGEFTLKLEYTVNEGEPNEQKCEDQVTVFVREGLAILDSGGVEITSALESVVNNEVRVQGSLSDTQGRYEWSVGPDGSIVSGGNSQYATLRFSTPGIKTIQAVYKPYSSSKPEQRATATIKVRDICSVLPVPLLTMAQPGAEVTLQVQVQPSGGRVRWGTPGANPSSGVGSSFTTVYPNKGLFPVNITYEAENGETCTTEARVQVGPPDCNLTISGPTSLQPGEDATFTILMPDDGGFISARLVESSEPLGFQTMAANEPFTVSTGFPFPGTYTLEATFIGTREGVVPLECRARHSIQVLPPPAAQGGKPRPADAQTQVGNRRASTGIHYWARLNRVTGGIRRGMAGTAGVAHPRPERLAANGSFIEFILNPETHRIASASFDTPADGEAFEFPKFQMGPDLSPDTDVDGLSDLAEFILGTSSDKGDTDADGITDLAEARAGTDPLGRNEEALGLVSSIDTGGYAWDICIEGDRLVVASGEAGLAVFNAFDRWNPVRVGALSLPGIARAVACSGQLAAVALGADGVSIVDVSQLPDIRLSHQLAFGSEVTCVAVQGATAFVGLDSGEVKGVAMQSGAVLSGVGVGGRIQDMTVVGRWVYVLANGGDGLRLHAFENVSGSLQLQGSLSLQGSEGAGRRRLRLVAEDSQLFAMHTAGYNLVSIANPASPRLVREVLTSQFGWRHVAPTGGELLLAAADPNSTDDGDHDLQMYSQTLGGAPLFESVIPTPGSAEAVVVLGNAAYVADGAQGLAVVRFRGTDTAGRSPTVGLSGPVVDQRVEEGKWLTFHVSARDDIGVARVEFYVDGRLLGTDASYPHDFNWLAPRSVTGNERFRLEARAIDTGGNIGISEPLVVGLASDQTPPYVVGTGPVGGASLDGEPVSSTEIALNEPLNAESVRSDSLRLFTPGLDGQPATEDDVEVLGGAVGYRRQDNAVTLTLAKPLGAGSYRARLEPGLRDRSGNLLDSAYEWHFSVVGPQLLSRIPRENGVSAGRSVEVLFRGPLDSASVEGKLSVIRSGPDGVLRTDDDVTVLGATLHDPGSPLIRREFSPPLEPGLYLASLSGGIANPMGLKLENDLTWEFRVVQATLGIDPLELKGTLRGELGADEYGLIVSEPGDVVISNPQRLEIRILDPQGALLNLDRRPFFKATFANSGLHVLRIAKGLGDFSLDYSVQIRRYTKAQFSGQLSGAATQTFSGRDSVGLGDEDTFQLTAEPGATYFLQPTSTGFPCPHQWSVFDPSGTPVRLGQSACGDGAVVVADQGGIIRVVFEAKSAARSQVKVTRAQTRNYRVDLTGRDSFQNRDDAQFQGTKATLNPGDQAVIEITVPAGERYSIADPTGSFLCMAWRAVGPDGKELFNETCETDQIPDTRAGGIYRLILLNTTSFPTSFSLELRRLISRTFEPVALTQGVLFETRQELNGAGSRDQFDFDLEAGVAVAFAPNVFSPCHEWQLVDPQGRTQMGPVTLCGRVFTYVPTVSGRHRLSVMGTQSSTSFSREYDLKAGRPGDIVSRHDLRDSMLYEASFNSGLPGSRRVYELELSAAQLLRVSVSIGAEGCNQDIGIRFVAPDGKVVWTGGSENRCAPRELISASVVGVYQLEITFPPDAVPDPFGIRVERVNQAKGFWRTLDDSRNPLKGAGTALLVRNDGAEIYVAGTFADGKAIARRVADGWEILGKVSRPDDVEVNVWELVHDGSALYAAGNFTAINGVSANGVARWNGTNWEALGGGVQVTTDDFTSGLLEVRALGFVGNDLYATGVFRKSGEVSTFNLARWDGTTWNPVPVGFFTARDGIGGELNPQSFDSSGSTIASIGDALYVGGRFLFPARNIGVWRNGGFDNSMMGGVSVSSFNPGSVSRIKSSGGLLYVTGEFEIAGIDFQRLPVGGFALWTGTEWRDPGLTLPRFGVNDFDVLGNQVVIGGDLDTLSVPNGGDSTVSTPVQAIGFWDGSQWQSLGRGVELEQPAGDGAIRLFRGDIRRLSRVGQRIYATGNFTKAGGLPVSYFGIWEITP